MVDSRKATREVSCCTLYRRLSTSESLAEILTQSESDKRLGLTTTGLRGRRDFEGTDGVELEGFPPPSVPAEEEAEEVEEEEDADDDDEKSGRE